MEKISNFICKNKKLILLISILLLIPTIIGIKLTKVNYDILVYLPQDNETVKGQNILANDFNMGAFSVDVIENMNPDDILKLEEKLRKIDGVAKVVSVYDVIGTTIPIEMFPEDIVNRVKKGDSELLLITFEDSTSNEKTLNAVREVKKVTKNSVKISGMSAMVLDTMDLSNTEITIYIFIAVVLCLIVLVLSLDSYLVPVLLLTNIGLAILYNLGSNIFLGEISYITKALTAVLQLGVTTDFSIFLYHSYESKKGKYKTKEEAMSKAIRETFVSVLGSSLTTIAGFLVLCTMSLTLGKDLGIVMAKGVLFGVLCVLTVFPSLLLFFDKAIEKTRHKVLIPKFTKLKEFVIKYHKVIFVSFLILLIPAFYGYSKVKVYYKIDESLPKTLDSIVANTELKEKFNIASPELILVNKNIKDDDLNEMIDEIKSIDGIDFILSPSQLSNLGLSKALLDDEVLKVIENDKYQLVLLNSTYDVASNELNDQITVVKKIVKKYDKSAIVAGEGPLMKDLISISDQDFNNVNYSSIICILVIMLLVLKSISLPILLICAIEFAIFVNMGISFYSGTILPFVAPIVLGTIQLGATIDYAILMTTTYLSHRKKGKDKYTAIKLTLDNSVSSIFVSGMCFFAATFGVGVYSKLEMVGSLCTLISRGAIISMISVIMILPSILLIFDKIICKTTTGFKKEIKKMKKNLKLSIFVLALLLIANPVYALTKNETVYTKLKSDGSVKSITVNEQLLNNDKSKNIEDETNLKNIISLNSNNKFKINNNSLNWTSKGIDIYYKGTIDKELPVDVSVKYYLNDKETSLKKMVGKKGNVKIVLKYTNKEKHIINNEELYTPFVVTTGLILKGGNNSNVSISNGKVISNGKNYILASIAAPGLAESLNIEDLKELDTITITYDTTKFEFNNIYSAYTSKLLEEKDLKVFNKFDNLYSNLNTLNNKSTKLVEGSKKILLGSQELKNSVKNSINSTSNVIDSSTLNFIKSQAKDKSKLTSEQKNQIATSIVGTTTDYDTLLTACNGYKQAINSALSSGNFSTIEDATNYVNNQYGGNLESVKSACQVVSIVELVDSSVQKAAEETSSQVATQVYSTTINEVKKNMNTLYNGVSKLDEGINTLATGITAFDQQGIKKIYNYINSTKNTSRKIKSLIELGNKYDTFTMKKDGVTGNTKFITVITNK